MRPTAFDIGTGDPVLALHSSASSKAQWRSLADDLGSRFRVLAVDLHGYGGNPLPAAGTPFGLDDEVGLVADSAITMLGAPQPMHVVGHSYGAAVALALARRRPGLVRSLTLYEPVCFNLLERAGPYFHVVRGFAERVAARVGSGDRSGAAREFIDYWSGRGSYDAAPAEVRARLDEVIPKVPLDFAALMSAPRDPRAYSSISAPTLLLSGRMSPESTRTIARTLWSAMSTSLILDVPGGHLMPLHRPADFTRHVARFLAGFPPARIPALERAAE